MCTDNEGVPRDCGFLNTCFYACSCDAAGCTSKREPQHEPLQVDGALDADGQTLVGTLVLVQPDTRSTIRLERQ